MVAHLRAKFGGQILRNVWCRERRPHGKEAHSAEQGEASTSGHDGQAQYTHILCISPDAPTNPVLYWLGNFNATETRFIMDTAHGPHKLDLGDTLYAPNLLEDEEVPCQLSTHCSIFHTSAWSTTASAMYTCGLWP